LPAVIPSAFGTQQGWKNSHSFITLNSLLLKSASIFSFEKIKEYQVPSTVHSASLHPSRSVFVCGGEDFKMYKMDYQTGQEIESFKGKQTDKSYFNISFT